MSIKINLKIFIFIALFFFYRKVDLYFLMMIFGILHELGHLIAGLLFKLKPKRLTIMPVGVMLEFDISEFNFIKQKELIISLAGPLVNLIIYFMALNLKLNNEYKNLIIYINLLMFSFNLLPIYPLDGGRVLKSILHIIFGYKKSIIITNLVSNIVVSIITILGVTISIYSKSIGIILVIIYIWGLVILENKIYSIKLKVYEQIQ